MSKKLIIGTDAAGFELKEAIATYLKKENIPFDDLTPTDETAYYETAQNAATELQADVTIMPYWYAEQAWA